MAEAEPPRPKPRPIVLAAIFLISHSLLVSVVCCIAGVVALLLLPVLAKTTYVSENALMPGSAHPMLSSQDVSEANKLVKGIISLNKQPTDTGIGTSALIAQHMEDLGAEVSYHNFQRHGHKFHPLHFFSVPNSGIIQENRSCSSYGTSVVGIIRAPRGDGKEAIVLVTPFNSLNISMGEALALGIASSVFSLLTQVTWLAKDIIWLAADSQHGEYASVAAWLRDYHTPLFGDFTKLNPEVCHDSSILHELRKSPAARSEVSGGFKRAGTIAAALVIKITDKNELTEKDTLHLYSEASNGQMPNLDLINVVNYLAVHRHGLRVKVDKLPSLIDCNWLKVLGEALESIGKVARSLNPQWKFGIPAADYVEGTATLVSSLYNQALGIPTGPHGAFRDYQVDAITLELSSTVYSKFQGRRDELLMRGGRLVEGVIRSVNNLLEKFHQSFFLYLLTSPSKFVSVGVYMIAFALLVAPLPLVAASLYSDAYKQDSNTEHDSSNVLSTTFKSWKWTSALKTVFVIHIWSVIITLFPHFITQTSHLTPSNSLLIWVLFSLISLATLHVFQSSSLTLKEWALLKSVTISFAFIGLCLMSVINFSTAEFGALLIVPMCLMATPLRYDLKAWSLKSMVRVVCNLVFVFLGFPPTTYMVSKGLFEGFSGVNVGDFWTWMESLWVWNSATYLHLCMVHLPCWVLCVYILLHRC